MKTDDEFFNNDKDAPSVNQVDDVPDNFKQWVISNKDRIENAKSLPYFLQDNKQFWQMNVKQGVGTFAGAKLGRTATKAAMAEYENAKPTTISEPQAQNIRELAKELGVKPQPPMTFVEANKGRANINLGNGEMFSQNCQCCVAIHEARLRGLNVTAVGYSADKNSVQYKLGERFQNVWLNEKGKTPQPTIVKGKDDNELFAKLEKSMSAQGRYHVGINYKDNRGHVFTAERVNGKLVLYDPQKGEFLNIAGLKGMATSFEVLRVDKLIFDKKVLQSISNTI